MEERVFATALGEIHYWVNPGRGRPMVFLPGLTADHGLFDKQIEAFEGEYPLLVWDAPGHGASRPFRLEFSLWDKAGWLHTIMEQEGLKRPVFVGQSMGLY